MYSILVGGSPFYLVVVVSFGRGSFHLGGSHFYCKRGGRFLAGVSFLGV